MRSDIPPALAEVVESFRRHARSQRWDTHRGSSGKCWFIAHAFALHASAASVPVEIYSVANTRATRVQDEVQNFAVLEGKWAVDFASRAGANGAQEPWPAVEPLDVYLARYGARRPMCPACGSTGDVDEHMCAGLLPLDQHLVRVARQAAASPSLQHLMRLATGRR